MKRKKAISSPIPTRPDIDTRVRCWDCKQWTHHIQVRIHSLMGTPARWVNVRVCALGLSYDPYVLRRCDKYQELPPGRKMPLPAEERQRGWVPNSGKAF